MAAAETTTPTVDTASAFGDAATAMPADRVADPTGVADPRPIADPGREHSERRRADDDLGRPR